jgi:hypothetical protein
MRAAVATTLALADCDKHDVAMMILIPTLMLMMDSVTIVTGENYADTLSAGPPRAAPSAASPAGTAWGADGNAMIRAGAWFEVVVNCHGLWNLGGFVDFPGRIIVLPAAVHR